MKLLKLKKVNEFVHVVEAYLEVILTRAQNGAPMEIPMKTPQEQEQLHPNSSRIHRMDL